MKIFISFSNKDIEIVRAFTDNILKLGLNIKQKEISCTGIENSKPRSGTDFKIWIEKEIKKADIIIQFISINYRSSEVCLNEMGAIWIACKNVYPILIDPTDYENVGFIHKQNQLLKINSKTDLLKFRDDIKKTINKEFDAENFNNKVDIFLKYTGISKNETNISIDIKLLTEPTTNETDNYFKKYLIPDIDIKSLLLKAQPSLIDCKAIFSERYYKYAFQLYSLTFMELVSQNSISNIENKQKYITHKANLNNLLEDKHNLPGGMTKLARKFVLKSNINFYSVKFIAKNDEYGIALHVWVYINDRWVFFVKPWRIIETIENLLNAQEIDSMAKFLRRFKTIREFKDTVELKFFISYLIDKIQK